MLFFSCSGPTQHSIRSEAVMCISQTVHCPCLSGLLCHYLLFLCPRMSTFSSASARHRIRAHMIFISIPMVCIPYHGNSLHLPIYDQAHFPNASQFLSEHSPQISLMSYTDPCQCIHASRHTRSPSGTIERNALFLSIT